MEQIYLLIFVVIIISPYFLGKYVTEKLFKKQYIGNYGTHSVIIFFITILFIGIVYTFMNILWEARPTYTYIIIPSFIINMLIEVTARTYILKNSFFFSILNSLFMLIPIIFIAYILNNLSIGF